MRGELLFPGAVKVHVDNVNLDLVDIFNNPDFDSKVKFWVSPTFFCRTGMLSIKFIPEDEFEADLLIKANEKRQSRM